MGMEWQRGEGSEQVQWNGELGAGETEVSAGAFTALIYAVPLSTCTSGWFIISTVHLYNNKSNNIIPNYINIVYDYINI